MDNGTWRSYRPTTALRNHGGTLAEREEEMKLLAQARWNDTPGSGMLPSMAIALLPWIGFVLLVGVVAHYFVR